MHTQGLEKMVDLIQEGRGSCRIVHVWHNLDESLKLQWLNKHNRDTRCQSNTTINPKSSESLVVNYRWADADSSTVRRLGFSRKTEPDIKAAIQITPKRVKEMRPITEARLHWSEGEYTRKNGNENTTNWQSGSPVKVPRLGKNLSIIAIKKTRLKIPFLCKREGYLLFTIPTQR